MSTTRKQINVTAATYLAIELETGLIYLDMVPIGKANRLWLEHAAADFPKRPDDFEPSAKDYEEAMAKMNEYLA